MSSSGVLQQILSGFADALAPLRDAVASPSAFQSFLKQFGWTLSDANLTQLTTELKDLSTLAANPSAMGVEQLAGDLVKAATLVRGIANSGAPQAFVSTFPEELLDFLVYTAVASGAPGLFGVLHFAGVFSEKRFAADATTGRTEHIQFIVAWSQLGGLADQPLQSIAATYGWGAAFDGDALVRSIGILVRGFGARATLLGVDPSLRDQYYAHGAPAAAGLKNVILSVPGLDFSASADAAAVNVRLALLALPISPNATTIAEADGLAVMPVITGQAADTISLTDAITLKLTGDFLARPVRAEFHPGSAVVRGSPGDAHVDASARIDAKAPATAPWLAFGNAQSSRLELSAAHVAMGLTGTLDSDMELTAEIGLDTAALVIDFSEGDSLMQGTVSQQPTRSPLSFTLKWSSKTGFSLGGQPKLTVTLPVQQSLAGLATLQQIGFALGVTGGNRLEFDAMLTGSTSIGPVSLEVQNVGLAIFVTPSAPTDPPGVLGNIDFGFGFKSPSGVGASLDVSGLTGGGFLSHDDAAAQYAGMLQLSYQQLQLQAFGLITTKLPTGPGYSMVAMIDANFPPIELVAGFTLNGVGGLFGVNRTIDTDALEAALKAHTLSGFLFNKNPVANAAQILTDLQTFFPPAQSRYIFGPLLQIGWGTPTVITIDLALILELPDPVRLLLLGELAVLMPVPDAPLLELHMDVLGTVDFGTDEGSLDAVLHDSRLMRFPLQGAMALRSCWAGDDKIFLLSIGGFHPKFQPPPGFPTLQRVSFSMPSGPISKLNLNGYFAVSSNTLQIGAHVDLFVGVDGFGISGILNFDTLIERDPFHFDGDISGSVTLSAGGDDLMTLDLSADLTGPAPWHCSGSVHFSVLGFGVTKSFSCIFGDSAAAIAVDLVDVGAAVLAALADPRNFAAGLLGESGLVSLRAPSASGVALAHPAGSLKVQQRVVPLGLTIEKFGAGAPQGDTLFNITALTVDGVAQITTPLTDAFAPAQFLNLSDDEELASPSFETFNAGVALGDGAMTFGRAGSTAAITREIDFETLLVDSPGGPTRTDTGITLPSNRLTGILSIFADSGLLRYAEPSQPMVRAATFDYVVATTNQIALAGVGATTGQTFAQARAALESAVLLNPGQRATLQVVPHYEVP